MSALPEPQIRSDRQPWVQLVKSGVAISCGPDEAAALRREFDRNHATTLPRFLNPELLALVQEHINRSSFYTRAHGRVGIELCLIPSLTYGILHYLMNSSPKLFRFVETLTGCAPIARFSGRVYRMIPGPQHYDSWHSDSEEERLIGLSLNLSEEVFAGSIFQLRAVGSDRVLCEVANTGFGDAVLFRIAPDLLHRITPLEGAVPKTAYAGWFRSSPTPPAHVG